MGSRKRECSAVQDGHLKVLTSEYSIQVNDLSCALVCVGLLPLMLKTSEATKSADHRPRITVVSSAVHYWTKPTPEQLASPNYLLKLSDPEHCAKPEVMGVRYPVSKRECSL